MTSGSLQVDPPGEEPPTTDADGRTGTLLASVTTRTLLRSLVGLCRMNDDARLIIAELVGRLPPDDPPGDPPAPDPPEAGQAPVMPM